MNPTTIVRVASLEEAALTLSTHRPKARVVAGGTDLLPRRQTVPTDEFWVDISRVDGSAREIRRANGRVVIGALVTFQALVESPLVRKTLPALHQAATIMGSRQIRTRATLGGNIGNASPAGDSLPPLIAGDAVAHLVSSSGRRDVPLEEFFVGPGQTILGQDELIEAVSYPVLEGAWSGFRRVGTRSAHEISKVSVALRAVVDDGRLGSVRVALGAVAPTPIRVPEVEAMIDGRVLNRALMDAVAPAAVRAARPITDVRSTAEYRSDLCGELVVDLLEALLKETDHHPTQNR